MEKALHTKRSLETPGTPNINSSYPMSIVKTHQRDPSKCPKRILWPLYLVLIHHHPSTGGTKSCTKKNSRSTYCAKPPSTQAYPHGNISTDRLTFMPLHLDQWTARSLFTTMPPYKRMGPTRMGRLPYWTSAQALSLLYPH